MNCLRSKDERCLLPGELGTRTGITASVGFDHCDDSTCDNSTSAMAVTSAQLRMARAALNWTVRDLAAATGLHRNTITNIEVGRYAGDEIHWQRSSRCSRRPVWNSSMRRRWARGTLEKAPATKKNLGGGSGDGRILKTSGTSNNVRGHKFGLGPIFDCLPGFFFRPLLRLEHCRRLHRLHAAASRSSVTKRRML